ncbi:sensor histidine kinase [Sulfitobacter aestuariivivens]|uniref:histidine kinase n=1 Tax=Sulfitobacter aestuariivivens TaxID=2766981 RepID=A0A927D1A4_9RHOB|nr:ATP-binding protein [Sulfitobacter aestuariivivens]MBD3663255.1 two-component sensor histidine kinase [Sulfitobacter aestuariivivens]
MPETLFDAVIAALPFPALIVDADEKVAAINERAVRLLGQGAKARPFITVLRQPALAEAVEHCLQDDIPRTATYLAGDASSDLTYDVHLQRMAGHGAVVLSFEDVTAVTQADQMRKVFVANVSHELRTPLTSLIGFIETLRGPARDDPTVQARFLETMGAEADRMNRLIGDLLSLSRLEAQERVRPTERINLIDVLIRTSRNINPLAVEADVVLQIDLGDTPIYVRGDSDQLQQVFTNLIENAIKYGGQGGKVDITAKFEDPAPELRGPGVRIMVADHGQGIEEQHLPRLTERFYRADSHRSRKLGGTGLGLAIVKHILNRHRGRLRITSTYGEGAQFAVVLPIDAKPPEG